MRILRGLGLGTLAFGLGSSAGCSAPEPGEEPGQLVQHIELHDWGTSYGFAFAPSKALEPGEELAALQARLTRHSFPIQATGAIIAPYLDAAGKQVTRSGAPVRFTCGATLVSPSYVVTAAHCVDGDSIQKATDTVALELYRPTSRLALESTWRPKTQLSGTFPDYVHGSYGAEDGYFVDRYACTLSVRCGSGSVNCPNATTGLDVALLHCQGRPGDRYGYLNVASRESAAVEVYVPWKHEVYDIAATEPTTSDKYTHYVSYPAEYGDNYHYLDRNQLLPLETIAWPDGTQPRKVSDVSQLTVWTDALGCHGTSGSGFLQQEPSSGAWELLGPTAVGGAAFAGALCEHLPGVASQPTPVPGAWNLGYSSVVQTRTVLSGVSAAWAADCAVQPLGRFGLGGRSGCARAQSGLTFAPRAAYRDLDPWRSPTVQIGAAATPVGFVQLESGKSYRVALGLTPVAGCTTGSGCGEVTVRVGGQEILRKTLQGATLGETALVGAFFSAAGSATQAVSVVTSAASFELGLLEIVENAGKNTFDTGYERSEAALVVPRIDAQIALPMRFVGDGSQGFAGLLYPGERMLLVREAAALQGKFSIRFNSSSAGALTCGLVDASGAVLASAPCMPGVSTSLSLLNGGSAAAIFIEGAPPSGVEIDDVNFSLDELAGSPCTDGVKNGSETDVDCGGSCVRCADDKSCAVAANCVSNICTAGKCVAAPSCTDGLKNGSESDVDCGGSCAQDCALGKACGAASDCVSNICTAGKCVAAPSCTDGLKNGSESDVDCGGSCAQDCALGKACGAASDCVSNTCTAGKCVAAPSCTDGLKNGSESDVDCGGSCAQDCALGKACGAASDCVSNICTAGKCVAAPSAAVVATLAFSSQWEVGYCANVTVTNKSAAAISSWKAVVNLAQGAVVSSWSAEFSSSGTTMTARSLSWNGQLAPNSSAVFGFCANKTGSNWQPSVVSASTP